MKTNGLNFNLDLSTLGKPQSTSVKSDVKSEKNKQASGDIENLLKVIKDSIKSTQANTYQPDDYYDRNKTILFKSGSLTILHQNNQNREHLIIRDKEHGSNDSANIVLSVDITNKKIFDSSNYNIRHSDLSLILHPHYQNPIISSIIDCMSLKAPTQYEIDKYNENENLKKIHRNQIETLSSKPKLEREQIGFWESKINPINATYIEQRDAGILDPSTNEKNTMLATIGAGPCVILTIHSDSPVQKVALAHIDALADLTNLSAIFNHFSKAERLKINLIGGESTEFVEKIYSNVIKASSEHNIEIETIEMNERGSSKNIAISNTGQLFDIIPDTKPAGYVDPEEPINQDHTLKALMAQAKTLAFQAPSRLRIKIL